MVGRGRGREGEAETGSEGGDVEAWRGRGKGGRGGEEGEER